MIDAAKKSPPEAPDPEESSWGFREGDEIVPGRHVLRRLGGGFRYEAYLAWDDRLYAVVVVKVLRPGLVGSERSLRGLSSEAGTLRRLDHPVIVRGFDAVLDGPRPHLVLEHLEGPRLSTLIRKYGPLPVEQLVPLAVQLCSALHYLHGEDVVHLDVKPSNIIMGAPPRLIDLSVALTATDLETLDVPVGTDAYMAPEQCDPVALGPVDPAADVWGLGVTLYRAATGERPFSEPGGREAEPAIRWPQLVETPQPLDGRLGPALAEPIMSSLARDPTARPRPGELAGMLEPVLGALPKPRLSRLKPRIQR
ncbi:MAG TPA: serine/threonine-protein kinase [Solirubrobacterales bacterium]|jgi:eukaryotic-like serine/threonine-protein kinase|nr:serine/threonine-protein kinase [Solirubrobacterales bacterium]